MKLTLRSDRIYWALRGRGDLTRICIAHYEPGVFNSVLFYDSKGGVALAAYPDELIWDKRQRVIRERP